MKIILAEDRNGQLHGEHTFASDVVIVGRDPAVCHYFFSQEQWPMVSRKHAEFRLSGGRYMVADANSRFGTFVNGQKITQPVEVRVGSHVQLGTGGPVLRVVSIEQSPVAQAEPKAPDLGRMETFRESSGNVPGVASSPQRPSAPPPVVAAPSTPKPPAPTPASRPTPAKAAPAHLELIDADTKQSKRIELNKEITRLGRDPEGEVVIDVAAAVVSRRHAEIKKTGEQFSITDLKSFNGTLVGGKRITETVTLFDGDEIQLGAGGPLLRIIDPAHPPAGRSQGAATPSQQAIPPAFGQIAAIAARQTIVSTGTGSLQPKTPPGSSQPQLLARLSFDTRPQLSVGRAPDNDLRLDGLQISNHHARFARTNGSVTVEDAGSTNGVYVNGDRISGRRPVQLSDVIQIGPFVLQADAQQGVAVYDTRSKTRIDCINIAKVVTNRSGGGSIRLLDDVGLTIQPNEFVGLLGPSGAGKSTLMDSLNGMRPATSGYVLINNLDLYRHLDSLKQSIGYVPQDDIIHRELTVYRTLYYVARLRLSRDVSTREIDQIVNEVMDVTGLSERRDVPVGQLSGGQRKRVSIAVELITKPSVIFLDEPTSGLDPATEEKIMKLFRQIAESGRTVVLTTHAMENVKLFDKIVVLMRGKLVFYGAPQEALAHVKADSFKDLYDKLEGPVDQQTAALPALPANATKSQKQARKQQREQIAEQVAEDWKRKFQTTEAYRRNVVEPLSLLPRDGRAAAPPKRRASPVDAVRQWGTLTRRYLEVLSRDKFNLLILFGQAPIIAFMTYLVVGSKSPRDFPFFMLALVSIWFGTSVASREIIRERAVYTRERMVNLRLLPYVASKLFVLALIVSFQCLLLFGSLKFLHYSGLMNLPGWAIPQLVIVMFTAMVGIALGLWVSAMVKTSEMATSLVPLILIPQILFSGLVGVPQSTAKVIGTLMPATWAFDGLKQWSTLDTLDEEGSDPEGENKGRGLYKHYEDLNDEHINSARDDVANYKKDAEDDSKEYEKKMKDYVKDLQSGQQATQPVAPKLKAAPEVHPAEKIPEDLSSYINFLHPWGNKIIDPLVLIVMFFSLVIAAIVTLRAQDIL
ncbi:MAG: transport system ATP-binding/permease protein [Blastocatellia bacterium]|jgi:ABC-type multidrug transport system ATPase subunit|nr:transport system ATP-binding/permease protein [Blastocatellia bacterium]